MKYFFILSFLFMILILPNQKFFHAGFQSIHGQRKHGENTSNGVIGLGPILSPAWAFTGIYPDNMGVFYPKAFQPVQTALWCIWVTIGVTAVVVPTQKFVGCHLRISHKNDFVASPTNMTLYSEDRLES